MNRRDAIAGLMGLAGCVSRPSSSGLPIVGAVGGGGPLVPFGIYYPAVQYVLAQELGVKTLRMHIQLTGPLVVLTLANAQAARAAGYKVIASYFNNGVAVTDTVAYAANLAASFATFKPDIAVIDNEENDPLDVYTPAQYRAMITAAIPVAQAAGVPIANGGQTCTGGYVAYWYWLWTNGMLAQADAYAAVALAPGVLPVGGLLYDIPNRGAPSRPILANNPNILAIMNQTFDYLAFYAASGLTYINQHLYSVNTAATILICQWLASVYKKPIISNEIGTDLTTGAGATAMIQGAIQGGCQAIIYFAPDGAGGGNAYGLCDPDGTLRPNGVAVAAFIAAQRTLR